VFTVAVAALRWFTRSGVPGRELRTAACAMPNASPMTVADDARPTLTPGWWVALTLRPDAAPLRVYVGEVQQVDEHGVRITLIDWLLGSATSWDFFAPWSMVASALVGTDKHHVERFGESASQWQSQMSRAEAETLIQVLDEQIEATEDEEERSRLTRLREAFVNVSQSVAGTLLSEYLKRVTGMTPGA
jgi:hypothetical protein